MRGTNNKQNNRKKNVDFNPTISIFTLNINTLNMSIKDRLDKK